ncbi:MAG: FliH/SctL family protein [Candidatus Zixiibacteriota bacterium]
MSKIIRTQVQAPVVFIGEKHLDVELETKAEKRLGSLFPVVSVVTDYDGAKFIPIQQIFKIEQKLQEEVEKAREQGYNEGFQAGHRKGLEEAKKVLQQFDHAIKDAVTQREALLEEARQKVLDLILAISRKVTFDAVEADADVTLEIINGVISGLIDRSKLKIKVNPRHHPIVEQNIERFLKESTTIKEITVEPDPRVRYGGCFIETPSGDIDARLESQFEVVKEVLVSGEQRS